ncbi:hypothetical protein FOA52_013433 [Chlamydomonas sp. UWO 241]|nr:hypothetical protein FOA52_013433 [Chlamydomonas sp. UWO 241]
MAAPAPAAPPLFSGTELLLTALTHSSNPPSCARRTGTWGPDYRMRWGAAVWEPEDLVRVAAVSEEMNAAATTADHLWEPLLERYKQQHPFNFEHQEYPLRIYGESCDEHSSLPHQRDPTVPALVLCTPFGTPKTRFDEASGEVSDLFIPASEDAESWMKRGFWAAGGVWLPRPPALLRSEPCGDLSFDCGRVFKEHCHSWAHSQMMHDPERRLPEEMWDPCCNPQAFKALSPQGRYSAFRMHVDTVMAAFDTPLDEAGLANMQELADWSKTSVKQYNEISPEEYIPAEELAEAAARCTVKATIEAVKIRMLVQDFDMYGLHFDGHDAYKFFMEGSSELWATWVAGVSRDAKCYFLGAVSGLAAYDN